VEFRGYVLLRAAINVILALLLLQHVLELSWFLVAMAIVGIAHVGALIGKSGVITPITQMASTMRRYRTIFPGLFRESKCFWASLLAVAIYGKIGLVLLKCYGVSNADIGVYAYLYAILGALFVAPAAIQSYVMRPLFAREMNGSSMFKKALPIYVVSGALGTYLFWKALPSLVKLVVGGAAGPLEVFWAFAPAVLIVYLANLLGLALMTEGKEKERAIVQWSAAIAHIALNVALIPTLKLQGAALATTGSYFLLLLGFLFVALKHNIWNARRAGISLLIYALASVAFYYWDVIVLVPVVLACGQALTRKSKIQKIESEPTPCKTVCQP